MTVAVEDEGLTSPVVEVKAMENVAVTPHGQVFDGGQSLPALALLVQLLERRLPHQQLQNNASHSSATASNCVHSMSSQNNA